MIESKTIKVKVLDKGFVRFVDKMGNDERVLQAARVSTGSGSSGNTKRDQGLINYLMMNQHWSPFEKVVFEFHVKCPIFVARQWFRHRTSSFNEASARYKKFEWECYVPEEFRKQDTENIHDNKEFKVDLLDTYMGAENRYETFLEDEIVREQARIVMPVGQYTEFYWTVNLRNLLHFIDLRADAHAQKEIQLYAEAILEMLNSMEDLKYSMDVYKRIRNFNNIIKKAVNKSSMEFISDKLTNDLDIDNE